MALNLYRRHFRKPGKCLAGLAPDSRTYEPEERRRRAKKCACPIYADGTLAGRFKRKNTREIEWDRARLVASEWEAAGAWNALDQGVLDHPIPLLQRPAWPVERPPAKPAITIEFAVHAYLANRKARQIKESTLRKYRTCVKQILAFAESRGYVRVDQFEPFDMDQFYGGWPDGIRSKAKKLERLKAFFRFCVKRNWIADNPAEDLDPPVGAGRAAHRIPFSDGELTRIYSACDLLPATAWKNHLGSGMWGGDDVKTMIMLLCWTGLRISDAATFDMSRVSRNPDSGADVFLRMHKTQGPLSTWIDDWLYDRLLARQRSRGPRIFSCGKSRRIETVTDLWRRRINKVFGLAGEFECGRPTPHVFRHTFVRLLLQRGVAPRDVAELIGDTEAVVLKHYARWVPERQERLTQILRDKLATAPRPNLDLVRMRS